MKKRLLFFELVKHLESKEALVITGMRQVGKTTLLRQIFDHIGDRPKQWFDLDNPLDQKIFEDVDYKVVYGRLREAAHAREKERLFIFIDEIQNFPEITRVMKYLIDHYQVKFFVTGSSNFYLRNLFPESLSGRKFLYELHPLSFGEYLYFDDALTHEQLAGHDTSTKLLKPTTIFEAKSRELQYGAYLKYGGFPGVVTASGTETKELALKNIFSSFFEKDLTILSDYTDVRELRDLILLLVPRVGSLLDVTKLASELGVDRPKVYGYLEFLQGVFFIRLLPRFSRSIDRSVAGGRKVYFTDTGLLKAVGNVNDGQLFENAVVNQLSAYGSVSFYNKRNTAEIDAILNKEIALEVKLRATPQDEQRLASLAKDLGIKTHRVISRDFVEPGEYLLGSGIL